MSYPKVVMLKNGAVAQDPYAVNPYEFPNVVSPPEYKFYGGGGAFQLQPGEAGAKPDPSAVTQAIIDPLEAEFAKHQVDLIAGFIGVALVILALSQIVKPL